jgi:hypothetical protein
MGTTDSLSWLALGAALTVAGLLAAALVWTRRGPGPGLRTAAWALLPVAAALTGLLRLLAEIADALADWAARLVFSPTVWLGVVVLGLAAVLWLAGRVVTARSGRGRSAVPAAASSTGLPGPGESRPDTRPASRRASRRKDAVDEDQDDIEAILRKHGIQ